MSRPPANAPRPPPSIAISTLPEAPRTMRADQVAVYERYGRLLLEAKMLAATDLPMLEAAARVRATLEEVYSDSRASPATVAALERLHKEQLIQLGLTPAARRTVPKLGANADGKGRLRSLVE